MDSKRQIILRLFAGVFYIFSFCFLIALALNYATNNSKPLGWGPIWADWLVKGIVLGFLGFFCQCLENIFEQFAEIRRDKDTPLL